MASIYALNTLSINFCSTAVTLFTQLGVARLSKGLALHSLAEESARSEILRLRWRSARLNARLREQNDMTHCLVGSVLNMVIDIEGRA